MSAIMYKNNVYGAGGASGGGGSSTLAGLSDVALSSPADGQILTYDSATSKWKNANPYSYTLPTASADTLGGIKVGSGLSIDNNGVLSASGGGGGGSYTETTLFTGTYQSYSGEITLDDDLDNYDQIIIYARWSVTTTNGCTPFVVERAYLVSHFPYDNGSTAQTSNHLVLCPYYNQYIRVKCGSANNKLFLYDAHSIAIERVAGIKY